MKKSSWRSQAVKVPFLACIALVGLACTNAIASVTIFGVSTPSATEQTPAQTSLPATTTPSTTPTSPTPTVSTPTEPAKPSKPKATGSKKQRTTSGKRKKSGKKNSANKTEEIDLNDPDLRLVLPGATAIGVPNLLIDKFKVPPFLLPIYQAAGIEYDIPWQLLASINQIETNYGNNLSVSSAGAVGWMQFMPATWKQYGVDANNDGVKDPYNPVDAIFSAARYLKAAGGKKDIRKAVFAYNHADWYVDEVILHAKLLGGLPDEFIGSLTGLTQGRFPVYAEARYSGSISKKDTTRKVKASENAAYPVASDPKRRYLDIYSRDKAPVIAVNDSQVVAMGNDQQRGNYIEIEDSFGNHYIYSHLGTLSKQYLAPKLEKVTDSEIAKELALPKTDPAPTNAASSSTYNKGKSAKKAKSKKNKSSKTSGSRALPTDSDRSTKQRLFANPHRSKVYKNGGKQQVLEAGTPLPQNADTRDYFRGVYDLEREDTVLKNLAVGSRIVAGTVIGTVNQTSPGAQPFMRFEVKPAGKDSPKIDPTPIVDGWKLLESTAIYRAAGINPFVKGGKKSKLPSVGQIMLMSKDRLENLVLSDPRIEIYKCGIKDIKAGIVDRRVLATLEFLASSGLKPTVTSLQCGHGFYTKSHKVSEHTFGSAVDISAINGIPIKGNQGAGSITEETVRKLLTLQGMMEPHQIISLMKFKGADNTLAMADHDDHIHIGFMPIYSDKTKLSKQLNSTLKPEQWDRLIDRLNRIETPDVPERPSRYAKPVKK